MTIKISTRQTCIRTIRQGDPKWLIVDGTVAAPRAGFEITTRCPREYKEVIRDCINHGWLKPIANVRDNELFWEEFSK